MASRTVSQSIRQRLYRFSQRVASTFSDSRRATFVHEMIRGIVISGHVHLSKVARAIGTGQEAVHPIEKRFSRHLGSEHWDASALASQLLRRSAEMVHDDTLIVADLTDLAKYYARKLEGLGRVHDGSDPEGRLAPGYVVFEAYVRVRRWQLFPLILEPLKTYAGAPTSENAEIEQCLRAVHQATGGKGTWVLDSGFDRRNLFAPLVRIGLAFVARLVGTRHVQTTEGRTLSVRDLADQMRPDHVRGQRWPRRGRTCTCVIYLPEVTDQAFLLVAHWRWPDSQRPLLLLVSPHARGPQRTGAWFVQAYRRRWGVEDATRGIKQSFELEQFLIRSWRGLRRLLWLVGWAFFWLNLWGEDSYQRLQQALMNHPWRFPKEVLYLFDWIAYVVHFLLHPKPKIQWTTE